jgi:hypothetical protein
VQEDPLEVGGQAGQQRLTRVAVGPQDAGDAVGDGADREQDDRGERKAAEEGHYVSAIQT